MKVSFIGFSFEVNPLINMMDFLSFLSDNSGKKHKLNFHDRQLFFDNTSNDEYLLGLLITIKDQKTFCELSGDGDSLKIIVNDVAKDKSIMDFNFFVLNKKSGIGMYQYYHQSCSFNQFGYIASRFYKELRQSKMQSEIDTLKRQKLPKIDEEKNIKTLKKKYNFSMKFQIILRTEKLEDILNEFEKIKSFEFDYAEIIPQERGYTQLKGFVKKERIKLNFIDASVKGLSSAIVSSLADSKLSNGRISVEDNNDNERSIDILNNPDKFGEYEYEDVTQKLNSITLDNFKDCWVIKELLKVCSEKSHIFTAKIE